MSDEKKQALKAADAYFSKIGASSEWPEALRSGFQPGERNPLLPVVFADGWLTGFHARDEEVQRLESELANDDHLAWLLGSDEAMRVIDEAGYLPPKEAGELRARAEASEERTERIKELSNLERNHLVANLERIGNYHHPDGKLCSICDYAFRDAGPPYPSPPTAPASTAGEPLDRLPTLTDPAVSEAMREAERADGVGEEPTGEASGS